ncbi:UNVERIFIED_CONTAM: hypothetical protein FKN15_056845 [Acipenser sinensis]
MLTCPVHMGIESRESQVLNVSLLEGETVTLEDLGGQEPAVLANESILMKGLVVRSWSNQVAVRFQSFQLPHAGSFHFQYQAYMLSCGFPQRPAYGDVTVSSLHPGGEAYFYCYTGYQLQGKSTLTCLNATTPLWSGKEPQCLGNCLRRSHQERDGGPDCVSWLPRELQQQSDLSLHPGGEAYFYCYTGYQLQGKSTLTCLNATTPLWSGKEPQCLGKLHVGKNDVLTFYDGDDLTAMILGQYSGHRGRFKLYTSMADVTIQFQSDPASNVFGFQNGFVIHFFEVPRNDTCPELPEIANGWKTTSHPELIHGTVVTYQCYPGFDVVGTEILMCQWDLTWSGDLPSCEKVTTCSDPGDVDHCRRVLSMNKFSVGSTVQYICNKGYQLSGNSLLTCYPHDSSGPKWSERLPKCMRE